nr:TonB-dependent receptor plug domain-containing protein [uncultured Chryseobacterium sp.]
MKKKIINTIVFLFLAGTPAVIEAQGKAETALQKFEENFPQEKVHLLFNKDQYVAGENLWFKSFVFQGYNRSEISTSLFVELYDSNKKLIDKKMILLLKGEGSGSFALPATLKEDVYFIRAYTTWMTNFSENFNYIRPLNIYNPNSEQKLTADETAAYSVTVHPESGTFINGINTKFAVRLHSKGITPSEWNGYITDTQNPNVPIVTFKGFDQNTGSFTLNPKTGSNYKLTVQDTAGKTVTVDLPEVASSGLNLQVQSTNHAVKYSVQSKNISSGQSYKVLGTINNQMVYKAEMKQLSDKVMSISTDKLINGILQLTVFDAQENIIAQRLCFVDPDILNIKKPVLTADLNTAARAKNSFTIGKDQHYDVYSIVVTDPESNSSEEDNSLLSSLWLTGDLTSDIVKPAQYFAKNHNSEALDALLISEKYSRFDWRNLIKGNFPVIRNKPQSYISYKGKVMSQGKPAANSELNLLFKMPDAGMKFNLIKTDENGLFSLDNLAFEETMTFSYQPNTKDKNTITSTQVYFQPNFSFIPLRKDLPAGRMKLTERIQGEALPVHVTKAVTNITSEKFINEKITDIEEVKIKVDRRDKTKKLNETLSSPLFNSVNELIFDFVNDNVGLGVTNILQWLQGRVPGLQISSQGANATATMRGGAPEFFLDEMRTDLSQISTISVSDVAMIKVIRGNFAGSFGGGNGAIIVYTRRGGITGSIADSGQSKSLKEMTLKGYDKEEPFKNEVYENIDSKSLSNDSRSTLYWNTYLQENPKEPTTVSFYNNDNAKSFKVIVIGFDEENDTPLYYNDVLK